MEINDYIDYAQIWIDFCKDFTVKDSIDIEDGKARDDLIQFMESKVYTEMELLVGDCWLDTEDNEVHLCFNQHDANSANESNPEGSGWGVFITIDFDSEVITDFNPEGY